MKESEKVIQWIRDYFAENGKGCKAVIGVSGGTDSSVVAALLVKALGKENVIGVMLPRGKQHDIDVSYQLVEYLGIPHYEINIDEPVSALKRLVGEAFLPLYRGQSACRDGNHIRSTDEDAVLQRRHHLPRGFDAGRGC